MSLYVRHRTASSNMSSSWEYDYVDRRVRVRAVLGAREVEFGVVVCTLDRPLVGAHPIVRIDGETWRVLPERVIRTWRDGVERLETVACRLAPPLARESVVLMQAPPDVASFLEVL